MVAPSVDAYMGNNIKDWHQY